MSPSALINAFRLNAKGDGVALGFDDIASSVPDTGEGEYIWVHLDWMGDGVATWLCDQAGIDPVIVETLATRGTRPSITFYDHGYAMNLRGVNLNAESDPADMISVRVWVSGRLVITLRNQSMRAFEDIRNAIRDGKAPHNPDEFVLTLGERLVFRIDSEIRRMEEELDELEEEVDQVSDEKTLPLRKRNSDMRHRLTRLRRHIAPQRDALMQFVEQKPAWPDKRHKRRAKTISDRTIRLVEELDSLRERIQITNDSLMALETERMNRTMYWLTVIAGLFLPISFVTGLLGVNVGGIPAAESPWGFTAVSAMLAAIVVLEIWLFRKMRLI